MIRLRGVVTVLLLLVIVSVVPGRAQQFSSVNGVVSDKTGAIVSGASVTLDNPSIGLHTVTATNDQGYYQFLRLAPAEGYQLAFSKDGFKTLVLNRLSFGVSTAETHNATLELGQLTTRIEVSASGEGTLNTTDASVGNVIDIRAVNELPIQFRLDAANLMQLQAGVNDAGSITGARSDQGNITLDGVDINDQATGQAFTSTIPVSVDALQEVRTITAGETPDFGRSSGGIINLETRSGTNDFHGNIREYNRNTLFEANDWFNNRDGVARAPLIRNQFGGSLGGPIKKDKLFFFFDYEGVRVTQGFKNERAVPTPQLLSGQLGYVNSNAGCDGTARLNNNINNCITYLTPAQVTALDPAGIGADPAILSLLQSRYAPFKINDPTFGDGINTEGFIFNAPAKESDNVYTGRFDYTLSDKHKFFVRASVAREGVDDFFNTTIEQFPGDPAPASRDEFNGYSFVAGWTWTISANKTNQLSGALTRAILEFPSITQPTFPNVFSFSADISSPYHGFASQSRDVPVPELRDAFSWSVGKHTMEFGTDIKLIRQISALENDFSFIGVGLGGQLQTLDSTVRPGDLNADPGAISDYDNTFPFLLGRYSSVGTNFNYNTSGTAQPSGTGKSRDFNYNEFEFYAQDSWKMRSDLTVTYGLRYQLHTVPYETNGFQSIPNIDLATYYSDRVTAAAQGLSGNDIIPFVSYSLGGKANHGAPSYYNPDYKDFGPRLGIAYNPSFRSGVLGSVLGDRKTVLRVGGALLHDRISGGPSFGLDQFTFLFDSSASNPLGIAGDPFDSLATDPRFTGFNSVPANIFPGAPSVGSPSTPNVANGIPFGTFNGGFPNFFQFNRDTKNPYAILMNFGIQRELPGNFLLEVGYVGRLGRRLLAVEDAAQVTNFKDPTSGHLLKADFAQLQAELPTLNAQVNAGNAPNIAPVPWFENQINSTLTAKLGPGANCNTVFGVNCATAVDFFLGQLVGKGDLSDTVQALAAFGGLGIIEPNVGLPAQTSANGYIGNYASSNYNAMLVTLRKRLSANLQFDFNYTLSHSIDNVSQIANNYVQYGGGNGSLVCDISDPRTCRASSDFDSRHTVSANYIYDLPVGRGQHFLRNASRALDALVGGWSTSGIVTWRTGYPFTINTGAFPTAFTLDSPAVLTGSKAALGGGIHTDAGGNLQYFANPNAALGALSFPIGGTIGNRNAATGPSFSNVDMGVTKKFRLPWSERVSFKLVGNAFNVFNHPSFNGPASATLSNPSGFGIITSTASAPRVLQVALRLEF